MKVIKTVLRQQDGTLTSPFAKDKWMKTYELGVPTIPDVGYLFAYDYDNLGAAKDDRQGGWGEVVSYWEAEAEVVGRCSYSQLRMLNTFWAYFWARFEPGSKGDYLLCSSITLMKEVKDE